MPSKRARIAQEIASAGSVGTQPSTAGIYLENAAEYLIDIWVSGALPAYIVGKLCLHLVADGVKKSALVALSKIGSSGQYPSNARRDLEHITKGGTTIWQILSLLTAIARPSLDDEGEF